MGRFCLLASDRETSLKTLLLLFATVANLFVGQRYRPNERGGDAMTDPFE
jgi:hypothetical protein